MAALVASQDRVLDSCVPSPDPVPPTMLFLFLFGSLDKHLLYESDKPCPKPQRDSQPKATNWGRPQVSAQAGLHQGRIVFHVFWLKLVKMKPYTSPGYQTLQSKPLRQKKSTFPLSRRARISPHRNGLSFQISPLRLEGFLNIRHHQSQTSQIAGVQTQTKQTIRGLVSIQEAHYGGRELCLLQWFHFLLKEQLVAFNSILERFLTLMSQVSSFVFQQELAFNVMFAFFRIVWQFFWRLPSWNMLFKENKCPPPLPPLSFSWAFSGAAGERTAGSAEEVTHIWISTGRYRMRVRPQLALHGVM